MKKYDKLKKLQTTDYRLRTKRFLTELIMPLLLFLSITSVILGVVAPANAQTSTTPLTGPGGYLENSDYQKQIGLPTFNNNAHANASFEPGASNITSAILYVVDLVKYLLGTIAVIIIVISGIRLITGVKAIDEVSKKQKENLKYAIIGLMVIIASDQFIKNVFYGASGEVYSSGASLQNAAVQGSIQIKGIYNLIEYFAAALAILMIVVGGVRLVLSGGNEEVQGKVKKEIMYAIVGLVAMGLSEFVIKDIVFPQQGATLSNIDKLKQLIVNLTNFASGFIATIAAIMYIYGGYLYVISFGNEDGTGKAKKVFKNATIGLLIAMAAFAIVTTTIKLEPTSGIQSAGSNSPATLPTNP